MGHNYKNREILKKSYTWKKGVTLAKKQSQLEKKSHDLKNGSRLGKSVTVGKKGHTWKNGLRRGVNMKAVFWLVITALTQISRLRFQQSRISMLIPEIYVLGRFVNFWVIFRYIWR